VKPRRSLSEVIGAFIVLMVVLLAAISLVRMGSEVISYSEKASAQLFERAAQEASPPKVNLVLNGSRLYMEVLPTTPINISYAVIEVNGDAIIEKVGAVASSPTLIPLPGNYACGNATIYVVTSSGAMFKYTDPTCAQPQASEGGQVSVASGTGTQFNFGPDSYPASLDAIYISGLVGGGNETSCLGSAEAKVLINGTPGSALSASVWVDGYMMSGTLAGGSQFTLTPLGYVELSGHRVEVAAYEGPGGGSIGAVFSGPGLIVNYSGSVSLSGYEALGATGPSEAFAAAALGYQGNFTSSWSVSPTGAAWKNYNLYYYYNFSSSTTGRGVTPGPVVLAYRLPLVAWGAPTQAYLRLVGELNLTFCAVRGPASVNVTVPAPLSFRVVSLAGQQMTTRAAAANAVVAYEQPFTLTFYTSLGVSTEGAGSGAFLLQASRVEVSSPPVPLMPVTSYLRYSFKDQGNGYEGAAWAATNVTPQPLAYALEVNGSDYSVIMVSPPLHDGLIYVNGEPQEGPVVAVIPGAIVSLPCPGVLYQVNISYGQLTLGRPTAVSGPLQGLQGPGLYLLVCDDQEYWIVYS